MNVSNETFDTPKPIDTVKRSHYSRSATIGQLSKAMAMAQCKIVNAIKTSVNPNFKSRYADLAEIVSVVRVPLAEAGLALFQIPTLVHGDNWTDVVVTTLLSHESGEWLESELSMTTQQNTPHGIGSAITYARRYALGAIVGVAPEDDDGNTASIPTLPGTAAAKAEAKREGRDVPAASKADAARTAISSRRAGTNGNTPHAGPSAGLVKLQSLIGACASRMELNDVWKGQASTIAALTAEEMDLAKAFAHDRAKFVERKAATENQDAEPAQ